MVLSNRTFNVDDYLRSVFNTHVREMFISNKCDLCGHDKELELHHNSISHHALCEECLEELGYKNKSNVDFTDREKYILANVYFMKSVENVKYMTLCKNCHMDLHENMGYKKSYFGNNGLTGIEIIDKLKR